MARIHELLAQLRASAPALAADIEREVNALADRRVFGLNFERHAPEAVELPGRRVRVGDKVRVLAPRGQAPTYMNRALFRVASIERSDLGRLASLVPLGPEFEATGEADIALTVVVDDLVVVAEFRDPIYPGLVSTGTVERGGGSHGQPGDKPYHAVINAENFHALQALLFTHRGKVDAIYIDPPYNSGAKDWKYNNDYVEADDLYRHSKWLAMMERRLLLAKELLNSEESVLIAAIDEKEYLRLGLLLQQVFPEANIQMISSVISPSGAARNREFTRVNEFIFFVMLGTAAPVKTPDDMLLTENRTIKQNRSPIWNQLRRLGAGPARTDSPSKFYPVLVDPSSGAILGSDAPLPLGSSRDTYAAPLGTEAAWPTQTDGSDGRWELNRGSFETRLKAGQVRTAGRGKQGHWSIQYLRNAQIERLASGELETVGKAPQGWLEIDYAPDRPRELYAKTVWNKSSHDSRTYGSWVLRELLPKRSFPFPKSLYAVEDALRFFIRDKRSAIVLDFFAGSGTTAHAVMRLNKQDDGRRVSISVTNNEVGAVEQLNLRKQHFRPGDADWESWGICEYITKPRIRAAIEGKTADGTLIKGEYKFTDVFPMADGFDENVEFFTLTHEAPLRVQSNREFSRIAAFLWLRAGSRGRRIDSLADGWDVTDNYGVLEDLDRTDDFLVAMAAAPTAHIAYIVTDEDRLFEAVTRDLPTGVEPVRLYQSYLSNFEIDAMRNAR
ncbi:site-specific DNA-methyltransferase [Microcella sp.]|uniref:site-specific DNA-methyltransferase n=1 Tax=Microcella sp. TaxID=1913979 RepID=UPI00255DF558|nr:DNA methyltransferase [Microcella sp.]MBX9471068.1 site-specific DNA-methyltransferase [Microcella sp.]